MQGGNKLTWKYRCHDPHTHVCDVQEEGRVWHILLRSHHHCGLCAALSPPHPGPAPLVVLLPKTYLLPAEIRASHVQEGKYLHSSGLNEAEEGSVEPQTLYRLT